MIVTHYRDIPLTVKLFKTESGWGYDILYDGDKFIHQQHIPSLQGKQPFQNKDDALKVAFFVAHKINNSKNIPAITIRDLDSLGIKYQNFKYQEYND